MSEYYGYFNGLEYDEKFVALVNRILVKNGVFDDGLMVSASGGMGVDVSAGAAIMNGFIYYNDEPKRLILKTAHATLPRIDSIMLRWDISASSINAVVVEGTPQSNPTAPAPVRSSTIFEFQLATVRVNAGVSSITAANITDTRPNQAVCGITSGYNGVNIDAMMTQYTAEFNEWFEAVKGQLSEDAAGNLQTQLDAHTGDEEIHITSAERTKWNEAAAPLQYHNAGVHNSVYRGKPLGSAVTAAQYAEIAAGTFKGLYIGDYWTISGVNYRIAAFDYYLGCGDTACTQHHVTLVPDSSLYNAKMNGTDTTEGGYAGSLMAREGIQAASNTIHTAFNGHVLYHRVYLVDGVTGGHPSSGVWRDSSVRLMTEQMVYGGAIYMPIADGSAAFSNYRVEKSQLPLFAYEPSRVSNGSAWWLRDVVAASSFAYINATGGASYLGAGKSSGVRPVFSIC